jgi:hypothetical protein
MTVHEWQNAVEPHAMLEFLLGSGNPSERKLRLFAVACSRRQWDRIDPLGRNAVDVAERFAEGFASPEEMRAARLACQGAGGQAAWYAAASNPAIAARNAARSAQAGAAQNGSEADELLAQAHLLRDIFGERLPQVLIASAWRNQSVVPLAQDIHDSENYASMPSLAIALEDAGCADNDMLAHCRGAEPHVKGCWVIDLILSKE